MKYIRHAHGNATVELTRRNLETLLAKLDMEGSARTLIKYEDDDDPFQPPAWVSVKAVADAEHYADRAPGEVITSWAGP